MPPGFVQAESIHKYAQGMSIAVPELPEAIQDAVHCQHKPRMLVPRIFMVPCSEWVPSLEGYGDRLRWAQKQTERAAVSSGKGKQKMTQDDDDGADDHDNNS
ncbi:hypothetical protein EDC04DRAFT_2600090 [Pisolithus marmoratus]|nr:hypothetical protein EDC04DRAFT_2600090 [Pisolithus marmoratus]